MKYFLAILLLTAGAARAQYSLALNLEKGKTYFLNINATIHFDGEMNGQKMSMNSTMTGLTKFTVVQVNANSYEMDASYDSLHMTMQGPMGLMEFSSGKSMPGDMTSGALNTLTNKHFNVVLLKNGAVSKISNPDTAGFASMMRNFPMLDGIKKMFLMGHVKHSFNAKAMKENMEIITAIFPNKKVNLNETWGSTIHPDSGTNNTIKASYQLTDYSGGTATIKGHGESKALGNPKQPMMGFSATYDMNGKSESTFKIDASTGWIKEADIRNDLSGKIEVPDNQASSSKKTIPIMVVTRAKISS